MNNKALVIPYRDRSEHLSKFIKHYTKLLPDFDIVIVEQFDKKPFNRGKLFNVFFLLEGENYTYFALHDVDMYLAKNTDRVVYDYPLNPTHIATRCKQFNYKMPYKNYFGGVVLISSFDFMFVNGFSNNIWSWGCEDDEFRNNILKTGMPISRREAYFETEDHKRIIDKVNYANSLKILKEGRKSDDGLHTCEYEFVSKSVSKNIIHFKVKL
jgi:hypothetical protein